MLRNKWALRIVKAISELECIDDDGYGLRTALEYLDAMLLEALEPSERKIYNYIANLDLAVVSEEIATEFNIKQNHASGLLKALTTYGLLDREVELDDNGRRFVYTVHNV